MPILENVLEWAIKLKFYQVSINLIQLRLQKL